MKIAHIRYHNMTVAFVDEDPKPSEDFLTIELPDDMAVMPGWKLIDGVLVDPSMLPEPEMMQANEEPEEIMQEND